MIEKVKAVNNPLTIIAIFAALAELAGTVALGLVDGTNQAVFIWFVMLFPTLIVVLFFLTLNYNPNVLYAPSDFQDEENFLKMLKGRRQLTAEFQELTRQIEIIKEQLVADPGTESSTSTDTDQTRESINAQFEIIEQKIDAAQEIVDRVTALMTLDSLPRSDFQAKILAFIDGSPNPVSSADIKDAVGIKGDAAVRALNRLVDRGMVWKQPSDTGDEYTIP